VDEVTNVRYLRAEFIPRREPAVREAMVAFGLATTACDTDTFVVSAYGDVDCVMAPELEAELLEAARLGSRRVLVDLRETTFFDSSAIHALLRSAGHLQAIGMQFPVVCSDYIKHLLEITGADQTLQIVSTLEQALLLFGPGAGQRTLALCPSPTRV
jgi:anti-anti-sigma factor